jgi:hypothetical protein
LPYFLNNDPVKAAKPPTTPPTKAIATNNNALCLNGKIFATRLARSLFELESISQALKVHNAAMARKPARKFAFDLSIYPIINDASAIQYQGINSASRCAENNIATNCIMNFMGL